jgi:hypothetical protein
VEVSPLHAFSGPLYSGNLFSLTVSGHAGSIGSDFRYTPQVLEIFPGFGAAFMYRLRPGAGAIAFGEARGCCGCNGKSKPKRSQLHDHGCLLVDGPINDAQCRIVL